MNIFLRTTILFSLIVIAVALLFSVNVSLIAGNDWIEIDFQEYLQLLIITVIFVLVGAFVSLFLSKILVRVFLDVRSAEIPESINELRLFSTVQRLSARVGISMPEIIIYQGSDINAFATGFRQNSAMLAISQQLLDVMTQDEMEGVIGHEISHIANGDMQSLALIQGVVNCIVYLPANCAKYVLDKIFGSRKSYPIIGYYLIVTLSQLSFAWLASLLVMWISRRREFHADLCGAKIAGSESMLCALECLQACNRRTVPQNIAMNYENFFRSSVYQLFISHPSISARITALRNLS